MKLKSLVFASLGWSTLALLHAEPEAMKRVALIFDDGPVPANAEPLLAVGAHVVDDRQQREPLGRQRVLDARRDLGEGVALHNALLLEGAEPKGQRAGAYARQRPFKLAEARAPLRQLAHEQQRPLAADDLGCHANRTCLIDRHYRPYFTK